MLELINAVFVANLKKVANRFPTLRRFIELDVVSGSVSRRIYRKAGFILLGTVTVAEENDNDKIIAAIASENVTKGHGLHESVVSEVEKGAIRLMIATSARRERLGLVFLSKVHRTHGGPIGYVFSLKVSFGARGMGIGRLLLRAVEKRARADRLARLGALVDVNNIRSLGLFKSGGFSVVPVDEISQRSRTEYLDIPAGKLLLEKLLS